MALPRDFYTNQWYSIRTAREQRAKVDELIARIPKYTYRDWELSWAARYNDHITLKLYTRVVDVVPDRVFGGPRQPDGKINFSNDVHIHAEQLWTWLNEGDHGLKQLDKWVFGAIYYLERHEMQEWFMRGRERVLNPHGEIGWDWPVKQIS